MTRNILFLSFLFFRIFPASAQAPVNTGTPKDTAKYAEITFETELINYGTILKGSDGNREFKFKNTGAAPLVISQVQSSCGCVVPSWPKEPFKPGQSGIIKVKYDTQRVGNFEKTLTVTTNSKSPTKILKLKGIVLMQNKEDDLQGNTAPIPKLPVNNKQPNPK